MDLRIIKGLRPPDLLPKIHKCPQDTAFGPISSAATNPKPCPKGSRRQLALVARALGAWGHRFELRVHATVSALDRALAQPEVTRVHRWGYSADWLGECRYIPIFGKQLEVYPSSAPQVWSTVHLSCISWSFCGNFKRESVHS